MNASAVQKRLGVDLVLFQEPNKKRAAVNGWIVDEKMGVTECCRNEKWAQSIGHKKMNDWVKVYFSGRVTYNYYIL